MSGPVEWAVLIFLGGLASGCLYVAWTARGLLAKYELKYDLALILVPTMPMIFSGVVAIFCVGRKALGS